MEKIMLELNDILHFKKLNTRLNKDVIIPEEITDEVFNQLSANGHQRAFAEMQRLGIDGSVTDISKMIKNVSSQTNDSSLDLIEISLEERVTISIENFMIEQENNSSRGSHFGTGTGTFRD
jgi:hypothetical protein